MVWWLDELPRQAGHPAYFRLANVTWANLFSRRVTGHHRTSDAGSQCRFLAHSQMGKRAVFGANGQ
jgi:hypothetical protein